MPKRPPGFHVVIGPDYAGKSSALTALHAREPSWHVLSTDENMLPPGHAPIRELRRVTGTVLPGVGSRYSPEFLAGLLQTAVLYLRNELDRVRCGPAGAGVPVLMDSYYYKILAKCRLAGVSDDNPMLAWWRTFPQPDGVVRLEVSADSAWQRCGQGSALNPLEHRGDRPDRGGFESYQRDLGKVMDDEVAHLPVTVLAEQPNPSRTARAIREAVLS